MDQKIEVGDKVSLRLSGGVIVDARVLDKRWPVYLVEWLKATREDVSDPWEYRVVSKWKPYWRVLSRLPRRYER